MAPSNALPMHGNDKTMNLNSLVLANIQASPYFKVHLYDLKTYHQVIDEIFYKVSHMEPWEKGSRKTAGQTGMCGGVRGVGTGGIVSSAFCLLFKLYTLKLTRKQLIGLCTHADSPYIRALGFMYIRFTQPPQDLWDWYEPYLDDDEEVDVKAGGGHVMTMGEMAVQMLTKLEWYSTLFPRIPVPIQKTIETNLSAHHGAKPRHSDNRRDQASGDGYASNEPSFGEAERLHRRPDDRYDSSRRRSPSANDVVVVERDRGGRHSPGRDDRHRSKDRRSRDRRSHERSRKRSAERRRSRSPRRRSPDASHSRKRSSESKRVSDETKQTTPERRKRSRERKRSASPKDRKRSSSPRERKRSSSREKRHHKKHKKHRSSSKEHRRKNGSSRHHRSRSPAREKKDRGYDDDLQKELERVRKAGSKDGSK